MKRITYILLFLINMQQTMAQNTAFKKVLDDHIAQTVPVISVDSLHQHFAEFTVLDTREIEEFEVSHIKNAIHVGYNNFSIKKVSKEISTNKPIVVYCSIGYRSEKIGEQLQKKGYNVYNLYGGIFHWTNQGYEVVNSTKKTTKKVHGYDKNWGIWLTKSEVVYGK
ncbi:MAG: rhodanese-like domain-containing protein [Vicingaceae bacterium]|nr:rhodanese-like domain-containing protein [Vicingaceae bacterium]